MAELRNIKWSKLVRSLLEKDSLNALRQSRSLQWWVTIGLRKRGYVILDDLDGLVLEYKGIKFIPDLINYPRMFEAWDRYRIDAVRKDDVVLDLGANIGSYTLPVARRARKVYAVEPLFYGTLCQNIALNRLQNVEPLRYAIGEEEVDCQGYKGRCEVIDLGELFKQYVGQQLDVLRMDIGEEEWNIPLEFFSDVRVFEIELHFLKESGDWNYWRNWLDEEGYGYLARWSKHKHWLYLSAEKGWNVRREVQLRDGSFRGRSLDLWKGR